MIGVVGALIAIQVLVISASLDELASGLASITASLGDARLEAPGADPAERIAVLRRAFYVTLAAVVFGFLANLSFVIHPLVRGLERLAEELRVKNGRLARSNDALSDFAYSAAHDLRAPLRAIGQLAAWIDDDSGATLQPRSRDNLALLRNRVERVEGLLASLHAYARAGREEFGVERIDSHELVLRLVRELPRPPELLVEIRGGRLPLLARSPVALERVFSSLLENAIAYHHTGVGRIEVSARRRHGLVEFTVRDDGPGIDPSQQARIFEPFVRLQSRERGDGSGLGLAFVAKVVRQVGGEVHVDSKPGEGASFRFSWPANALARVGINDLAEAGVSPRSSTG